MNDSLSSIHVIGSQQFGGAEHFLVRLVEALQRRGHSPLVVYRRGNPMETVLSPGIRRICLPFFNNYLDYYTIHRIRRLAVNGTARIVQTYMGRATRLTRLAPGGPTVHVARLGGFYKIKGRYQHAHAWVGNSRALCDHLVREGLPRQRVFHIGNFVALREPVPASERSRLRRRWGIADEAMVVFSLGRLIAIKGFDDLLRAVAQWPDEVGGRPWVLMLAGDGPLAASLRQLAQDLGIARKVRWLGWQNDPAPLFRLADVFVCPSRYETLGNVILEAWSFGLPVVSTETSGARELVVDGVNGLTVPVEDPGRLAACLLELCRAGSRERRRLGEAGRETVRTDHSEDLVVGRYLEMYRHLIAELA